MDHTEHIVDAPIVDQSATLSESIFSYFSQSGFMPHGHCYLWKSGLVTTHVVSDFLIGSAYLFISITLYRLVRRINLPFSAVVLSFGLFIAACGATHFVEIWNLWNADYWFGGWVKLLTAMASVATAIYLWMLRDSIFAFAKAARDSESHRLELVKLNQELKQQKETLELINRELESFSYSVSHDLRAPLRNISGFSDALIDDYSNNLTSEAKDYLAQIRDGIQRMGCIIDDLLNLARITKTDIRIENVNLSQIAEDIVSDFKKKEPHRAIEISIEDEMIVSGDSGLMKIALENLFSNAWKFTSKVEVAKVEFASDTIAGESVFYIRDNGAGFDMSLSSRLFTAFQRLHSKADFYGTGVGLATVFRIVERHDGKIWAESIEGEGATFYFTIGKVQKTFNLPSVR